MDLKVQKIIQERYWELPVSIKGKVDFDYLSKEIKKISNYYRLSSNQKKQLVNEIILVLFFFEPLSKLQQNLQSELGVSKEVAGGIYTELELEIFYGITETLNSVGNDASFERIREGDKEPAPREEPVTPIPPKTEPEAELPKGDPSVKERLELRPEKAKEEPNAENQNGTHAKPLTKEDLYASLSLKRTMADDIEAVKGKGAEPPKVLPTEEKKEETPKESPEPPNASQ